MWLSDRLPAHCTHAEAHQFCLVHLILRRRTFIGGLAGAAAWPVVARAQRPVRR
jgi:hypothetical protein